MTGRIRRHVIVTGRVQGVGFRFHTADEANRLGVAGWVRNLPDGTVEAEFEGAAGVVEQMLAWVRVGPPSAEVTGVQIDDAEPGRGTFSRRSRLEFRIR